MRMFKLPVRIAHIGMISLKSNEIDSAIQIVIPDSTQAPSGFGLEKLSRATLAFPIVPENQQTHYNEYQTKCINNWNQLEQLFNALKLDGFNVTYTYNSENQLIVDFRELKQAIIDEVARYEKIHADKYPSSESELINIMFKMGL